MFLKCFALCVFCFVVADSGQLQPEFFCERLQSEDAGIYKKLKDFANQNLTEYRGAYRLIECENIREKYLQQNDYLSEFEGLAKLLDPVVERIRNEKCKRQMVDFVASLRNSSLWAVQSKYHNLS